MEPSEVTGTYTYRGFLNEPTIFMDFNKPHFAEAERPQGRGAQFARPAPRKYQDVKKNELAVPHSEENTLVSLKP